MAPPVLFDTDVLIDAGRKDATALALLVRAGEGGGRAASVVTEMELLGGAETRRSFGSWRGFCVTTFG